jgi:hypothetical protein
LCSKSPPLPTDGEQRAGGYTLPCPSFFGCQRRWGIRVRAPSSWDKGQEEGWVGLPPLFSSRRRGERVFVYPSPLFGRLVEGILSVLLVLVVRVVLVVLAVQVVPVGRLCELRRPAQRTHFGGSQEQGLRGVWPSCFSFGL